MQDWTEEEWVNLEQAVGRMTLLLSERERLSKNSAWVTHLRLTLKVIAAYIQ